jgi:exodeoxyribonuclease VII large subunit
MEPVVKIQTAEPLQTPRVFPLSAITDRVKAILQPACAKTFWVRAEISSGREASGSFYCDLVEVGPDGKVVAKLRSSIWTQDLRRIRSKFEAQGIEFQLTDGSSVVLCCALQFSPQFGLSLKVTDADPVFALGEMERRKQEILEGLRRDGLLEPNKLLFLPSIPRRIGLITSQGSAAYHDFTQTLSSSGYAFTLLVANSAVQGTATEPAILRALASLPSLGLDLIVVIRGGGSKTDLAWLDSDAIARAIANCPIPVWSGIGHEIDISVLDHVSHRSFKTPTALAEDLVARCVAADRHLEESAERLKKIWRYQYDRDSEWVRRADDGIRNGVRKHLETARARLREAAITPMAKVGGRLSKENGLLTEARLRLKSGTLDLIGRQHERLDDRGERMRSRSDIVRERAGRDLQSACQRFQLDRLLQRFAREDERLAARMSTVQSHNPELMLRRGYALLRDDAGKIVTSVSGVKAGAHMVTQMSDGNLKIQVRKVERRRKEKQ